VAWDKFQGYRRPLAEAVPGTRGAGDLTARLSAPQLRKELRAALRCLWPIRRTGCLGRRPCLRGRRAGRRLGEGGGPVASGHGGPPGLRPAAHVPATNQPLRQHERRSDECEAPQGHANQERPQPRGGEPSLIRSGHTGMSGRYDCREVAPLGDLVVRGLAREQRRRSAWRSRPRHGLQKIRTSMYRGPALGASGGGIGLGVLEEPCVACLHGL